MRRVVVRIILVVIIAFLLLRLTVEHVPAPTDDFISYWAAARLVAQGGNPYDPLELLAVQQSAGWRFSRPLPVWYGPWILAAAAPAGLLPYWPARAAWMTLQIVCVGLATVLLWRFYGGPPRSRRPLVLAVTFAPAVLCIFEGQVTPIILLGAAGFVLLAGQRRDWLAGAALFPLTAKPLTLYLLLLTIGVWSLRARRIRIMAGLVATVAAASIVALALNPGVFAEWLRFSASHSPLAQAYTPTFGSILRRIFGTNRQWLAYLSVAAGLAWWLANWRRFGSDLDWREQLPALSFASLLTAPFAWSHDALLLFPAAIHVAAAGWTRADSVFWLIANATAVGLYPLLRYAQIWYLLYPATLLTWWRNRRHPQLAASLRTPRS